VTVHLEFVLQERRKIATIHATSGVIWGMSVWNAYPGFWGSFSLVGEGTAR
jgi:hypothetical protein